VFKKKRNDVIDSGERCSNYRYSIAQILISIKCFVGSSAGFRGLSRVFQILKEWVSAFIAPAYTTIRQWLLKIGLYKLQCPKYSPRGWFFVIDTSIQMGPQKCVVVLGVKNLDINNNFCPTLNTVEPLVIRPLNHCSGEVINEVLQEAAALVGSSPIGIVSDEGSENKRGVRIFVQDHSETVHLFDASHKINNCLKRELNNDPVWLAFKENATNSVQHLKLSSIAHLAAPRQRSKSRMHSAFYLINWGVSMLRFLDSEKATTLTTSERSKIEWIKQYQFALPNYLYFEEICKHALEIVHERGYFPGMENEFCKRIKHLSTTDQRYINFQNKIKTLLQIEGQKIPEGVHYLGSTEILESLFGKFKAIEGSHASSGLTSLVLAIPALLGKLDESVISKALTEVSVNDVEQWVETNMGQTFLSQRRHSLTVEDHENLEMDLNICE
jgi:hypothetical protein